MVDWRIVNDSLNIVIIVLDIILGISLIQIQQKKDYDTTKKYFMGISLFFFAHAIARFVFILYVWIRTPENKGYQELYYLGILFGTLCVIFIIYALESTVYTKSKFAWNFKDFRVVEKFVIHGRSMECLCDKFTISAI